MIGRNLWQYLTESNLTDTEKIARGCKGGYSETEQY